MKYLIVVLFLGCSACSSMQDFNKNSELYWQALHIVDVAQTVQIAKNPHCHNEGNQLTQNLIGKNPSEADVYKWGVGMSIVHFFGFKVLDKWLDDGDFNVPFRLADNIQKTNAVVTNHTKGGLRWDGLSDEEQIHCDSMLDGPSISIEVLKW